MSESPRTFSGLAALLAEPSRAAMLEALMDGRAWTGRELARAAGVTPPTASLHLRRLVEGALVRVQPAGRHHYYRLASAAVGESLEALMLLARPAQPRHPSGRAASAALRLARTCYDHLAGNLGVALAAALRECKAIVFDDGNARLTPAGEHLLTKMGIALESGSRRPLCRSCLDWTERLPHLGGRVGAALARYALDDGWVTRIPGGRALAVTERGIAQLRERFDLDWHARGVTC